MNYSEFLNCTVGNASIEYSHCLEDVPPYEDCPDPTACEDSGGNNVGLAFGLTIGAGLATTLGALLPFVPVIKPTNTRYLAAAMALAAGVMLYVSFTEIRTKSLNSFCCKSQDHYDVLATSCFFFGILLTVALDSLVWALQKLDCGCNLSRLGDVRRKMRTRRRRRREGEKEGVTDSEGGGFGGTEKRKGEKFQLRAVNPNVSNGVHWTDSNVPILPSEGGDSGRSMSTTPTASSLEEGSEVTTEAEQVALEEEESVLQSQTTGDGVSISVASNTMSENTNNITTASVNELFSNSSLLRMNAIIPESASACAVPVHGEGKGGVGGDSVSRVCVESGEKVVGESRKGLMRRNSYQEMVDTDFQPLGPEEFREVTEIVTTDKKNLKRMGLLTGLAIALHNFPEGLATFVATLSSPSLGGALALAIALHNIPEGVCVSMPVYYATGSKVKAFLWAFLSGVSEPLAAVLGWLVLKDHFGPLVYGISFGIIAGMMVYISLKELLPTAYKFDKNNKYIVPAFLVTGMVVMALSLLLFLY